MGRVCFSRLTSYFKRIMCMRIKICIGIISTTRQILRSTMGTGTCITCSRSRFRPVPCRRSVLARLPKTPSLQ